ncbi:MAG: hypothetical protein IPK26_28335 [Planctomycetes bacterium]|nr:hypothetical protein [Planctomycetota bacterium]
MAQAPRSTGSAILVAAVITLVVSVVRLIGELQGWNDTLFNRSGPGPDSKQGLFGITFLIPIFGIWFGWRLRRATGGPPHTGKAALVYVLGAAVLFGGFAAAMASGLIAMPTPAAPGVPGGMPWAFGLVLGSLLVATFAWPRLTATLLVYALLARIPVVVITFLAVANDWDTHYAKLPPDFALPAGESKAMFLSIPQGTFWIAFTVLVGGLCGCLGAALARRKD